MFWLGLLLPICYIPGITGASIPTQQALLSLVLPAGMWAAGPARSPHWLGLGFVLYAILGLLWSPNIFDGIFGVWTVAIWGLSFWFGYIAESDRNLYRGLAIGLSVSSILAVFQFFGYQPVPTFYGTNVAGLFFNSTVLGGASALLILGLIERRLWFYIIPLIPGLILCHSRGAYLALAVALAYRYIHWTAGLVLLLIAGLVAFRNGVPADLERLDHWIVAWKGLTLLGWGPGSFIGVYYLKGVILIHPEFVHNDYIQLWFEFGIASLAVVAIFALALVWSWSPVLLGAAVLATFWFPLCHPLTAFIACFAAGHGLRGFTFDGLVIRHCRPDLLPWNDNEEPASDRPRATSIPIQSRA